MSNCPLPALVYRFLVWGARNRTADQSAADAPVVDAKTPHQSQS